MKVVERLSLKEALSTRKPHLPGDPGSQPGGKVPQRDECSSKLLCSRPRGKSCAKIESNKNSPTVQTKLISMSMVMAQ